MGYMKDNFVVWARTAPRKNGNGYSEETINGYVSSLKTHCAKLTDLRLDNTDLFAIDKLEDFDLVIEQIIGSIDYERINAAYHRIFSSALKVYRRFLESFPVGGENCMQQQFEQWLASYPDHKYLPTTIKRYVCALQNAGEWLGLSLPQPILSVSSVDGFDGIQSIIKAVPDYAEINKAHGHGDLSAALRLYGFFLKAINQRDESVGWKPALSEYDPGITKDRWLELLNDGATFTDNAFFAIAALFDIGGEATCSQLEVRYGRTADFYRSTLGTQLASKVREKLNIPYCITDNGEKKVWPILFQGRKAATDEAGSFVWRIRPALREALEEFDVLRYLPDVSEEEGSDGMAEIDAKEFLEYITTYIAGHGFDYPDGLIENFYLSLKTKPFVILAGTSGTGKTRLVKLFAEAIGASFYLVSVRPDWSDGSDLFGHTDLNGNFIPGPVCAAFDAANADRSKPVFLCLDEMNLARVEYYLSDYLSVIESREKKNGHIVTERIAQYTTGIPDNLYIIGTVNMDETTFPFSKKVLDRANTIEFNYVDLMPKNAERVSAEPLTVGNQFLQTEYLVLATDCDNDDLVERVCRDLQALNSKLVKANAHIGYRVRDEVVFYLTNNKKAGDLLTYEQALDNEIMQKILPRIQGSSSAIKTLLLDLFKFCMGNSGGIDAETGSVGEQMKAAADRAKYPASAEKIGYMMTRFEDDGFTSYWL